MKFTKFLNRESKSEIVGNKQINYRLVHWGTQWPSTSIFNGKIYIGNRFIRSVDSKTLKAILAHEEYHALSLKPIALRLAILAAIISSLIFLLGSIGEVFLLLITINLQYLYFGLLSLTFFGTIFGLLLYFIKYNERAGDMHACLLVGKSAVINSLKKLEELKKTNKFKPSTPKLLYEVTHGKFEGRAEFVKNFNKPGSYKHTR